MEQSNGNVTNLDPNRKSATRKGSLVLFFLATILASAIIGAVFGFISGSIGNSVLEKISPKLAGKTGSFSHERNITSEKVVQEDSVITDMVQKSSPAVVSIVISKDVPQVKNYFDNFFDPFGFFNGQNQNDADTPTQKEKVGGGTGFFINSQGMIVTNKHVVDDSRADYTVLTSDGKEYPAKILARDPVQDFAVIKIEGNDFPKLETGDSDSLKVGQTVIAIGYSLGEFSNTVSKGIISGLKREVVAGSGFGNSEKLANIIQTDAAINPGNSGGPLLNINGEVIGMNVAIAQGAQNVGFAIPINQVKDTISQVESTGKISTPFIGVRYVPITPEMQKKNNLDFDYGDLVIRGNEISDLAVIPGSPADKAGIVENDIILEVNGTKIDKKNQLSQAVSKYKVGDKITLKIWHKGETKDVQVKLEERKSQ